MLLDLKASGGQRAFLAYDFIRTDRCIYRIFGADSVPGRYHVLLRYYKNVNGNWIKPPKYAAEAKHHAFLSHYDVPLRFIPQWGLTLGIFDTAHSDRFTHFRPTEATALMPRDLAVCCIGYDVGLIGSQLVGLATDSSDCDLVIYGPDETAKGRTLCASLSGPPIKSTTLERFRQAVNRPLTAAEEEDRNIYSRSLRRAEDSCMVKVDLHYCSPALSHVIPALDLEVDRADSILGRVTRDDERHLFPGTIGLTHDETDIRVHIKDHTLKFVRKDDELRCSGYWLRGPQEALDQRAFVCERLDAVVLSDSGRDGGNSDG